MSIASRQFFCSLVPYLEVRLPGPPRRLLRLDEHQVERDSRGDEGKADDGAQGLLEDGQDHEGEL